MRIEIHEGKQYRIPEHGDPVLWGRFQESGRLNQTTVPFSIEDAFGYRVVGTGWTCHGTYYTDAGLMPWYVSFEDCQKGLPKGNWFRLCEG